MGMTPQQGKSRIVMSEINVTPFVDVMLVLLIIFMVTAPMMQQGIDVDLPETASSGVETNDEPFILVVDKKGRLSAGEARLKMNELRSKLTAIFKTRKNKQIYIQADKNVNYGIVAQTMGEVRAAGISQISLVTLPKSN